MNEELSDNNIEAMPVKTYVYLNKLLAKIPIITNSKFSTLTSWIS